MAESASSRTRIRLQQHADGAEGSSTHEQAVGAAADAPPLDEQPTIISQTPPWMGGARARQSGANELGRALTGTKLDHFELDEFVGGGGMGAVFRARDTLLNREVAVKILARDQAGDEETLRRFQNEAQSAARLDHPNIARVYYVGSDHGFHYIVFEFIRGTNIRDLVERAGPLPLREALSYTVQIAQAIEHASSRDVVHRDIKPSNVLIMEDGTAKLVDMGLARLHQVDRSGEDLTASGVTLGTFDYISPEQARDPRLADVRSDIYSLGCTLYFMLAGRPPFPEGTVLQKLLQHQGDEPPDPRKFQPDLPDQAVALVRKMLAKDPRKRFATAAELLQSLAYLAEQHGVHVAGAGALSRSPPPVSQWQAHLSWLAPVALLICTAALLQLFSTGDLPLPEPVVRAPAPALPPLPAGIERTPADVPPGPLPGAAGEAAEDSAAPGEVPEEADGSADAPAAASQLPPNRSPGGAAAADDAGAAPVVADDAPSAVQAPPPAANDGAADAGSPAASAQVGQPPIAPADERAIVPPVAGPASPAPPEGQLTVTADPRGPRQFASLKQACAAANDGDVIELDFDGPLAEQPIVLLNRRLGLRARTGRRPVISFRPANADPQQWPSGMISVRGGSLTVVGVALELQADVPAERWALFELQRAESLRLERCAFTVRSAVSAAGTAVVWLHGGPMPEMMMRPPAPAPTTRVTVQDCLVRGQTFGLAADAGQSLQFDAENCLLACSEPWLELSGSAAHLAATTELQATLRHVTAVLPKGLLRCRGSLGAPHLPAVAVRSHDSIYWSAADAALVDFAGVVDLPQATQRLAWDGTRNFYEGFLTFLRLAPADGLQPPTDWNFSDWTAHWTARRELLPRQGSVLWQNWPKSDRDPATLLPEDFRLSRAGTNLAVGSAEDGSDAGANLAALPTP